MSRPGGKTPHLGVPPELQLPTAGLNQVRHHAVLGHGLAVQAIRARGRADTRVSFAENGRRGPGHRHARIRQGRRDRRRELDAPFLTVMLEGRYTDGYLAAAGSDVPKFPDEDLTAIGSPVDFAGINVYRPNVYVAPSGQPPGYRTIPISASHPKMASAWHVFDPEVMYWAPRQVTSLWGPKSIFITENGCATADAVSEEGNIYDSDRVMFLRAVGSPQPY